MAFFWFFLTILFWGVAPIFEKIGLVKAAPFTAITVRTLVIAILLLSAALISGQVSKIAELDFKTIIFVIIGGLFAGLFGQITYFYALKQTEASKLIPLTAAYPLVTVILGVLVLSEEVTLLKIVGTILVVSGVWLLH